MKYKVGDKVRIKSIDWYNENKDADGFVHCGDKVFDDYMSVFCGSVVTIGGVYPYNGYDIREDMQCSTWTDEMIEGLSEEIERDHEDKIFSEGYDQGYEDGQHDMYEWVLPEGFQFKDENGNVINAQKIVLEKKDNDYPKTYEECVEILGRSADVTYGYKKYVLHTLQMLLVCRDAYWQIAGQEMGLEGMWEPDYDYSSPPKYIISCYFGDIIKEKYCGQYNRLLSFPTEEMRDAFFDNFKEEIDKCKELL